MKKIFSILLLAALCFCGNMQADELGPLYDGTHTTYAGYIPLEGGNADRYQHEQIIYPKADLTSLAGKKITALTFYLSTKAAAAWNSTFEIRLGETSTNSFASTTWLEPEKFELVYTGTLDGTGDVMVVTFDAPFEYSGDDNLLFDLRTKTVGNVYKTAKFVCKGGYDNNYTMYGAPSTSGLPATANARRTVLPKTLFTYEDGAPVSCEKPTGLKKIEVAAKTATLAWDKVADANWQYICLPAAAELNWENATTTTDTFAIVNGLTSETNYKFYVRRYCSAEDQSKEVSVAFQTEKSCFAPTSLNVAENDVTTTTAKITWGASGKGETSWQYTYEVWSDEVPDWSNAVVTDQKEVTLTNLTPKSMYQIWVRSYCADDDQSAAITEYFTTKVDCSATALPYEDDFSSGIECWTLKDCVSGTGEYQYYGEDVFRFYYTTTPPQYLISPEFVASTKQAQVSFDCFAYSHSYEESFKVGYSTTDKEIASFTWGEEYKTQNDNQSNPDKFSTILPAGVKFVAIQYTANNKFALQIDNFKVEEYEAPSCAAPTALTVSEVADKTAKATWTSEAEKFALELKAEGGEWTAVDAVITEPAFELTNLNEHTTYQVRVKAICGEELESEWVESEAFTTICSVKEFGYEETFAAELDACWDNSEFHGNQWTPTTDDEQDYFLRYKTSDNAFGKAELVSPAIALLNEGEPVLLFYWMNTGVPGVTLKIWDGETESVLSEDLDAELNEVTGESDDRNWQIKKANLSEFLGKTVAFKLHADGNAKNKYAFFDNFKVCQKPYSLLVPTNVQAVATEDGAVITWTAAWDEPAWDLQYGPKDANKTVVPGIAEKTYTITGLSEGEYEVQVRAAFAAEPSAWTEVVTFEVAHEATGIDNTAAKATATKRIVNGQLIIERNGEQYNAQGVSVK